MIGDNAPQYRVIDKVGMPHVMRFIVSRLTPFDTADIDWLKLLPLKKNVLLHGECMFPYVDDDGVREHGFRIRASVNVQMSPPFTYEHWGRVRDPDAARGWRSGEQLYRFADLDECAVHTLGHECFHFLSETKQIPEKNTEANANWWADGWLASYRLWTESMPSPSREPQQLVMEFND